MRAQHFYRGLASLLRAGVLLNAAVDELARNGTIPLSLANAIHTRVGGGEQLSAVLAEYPAEFRPEDVAFLSAGEETGRLDATLDRLAELHEQRDRMWDLFRRKSLYPLFLFHAAAFIMPVGILGLDGFASGRTTTVSLVIIAVFWCVLLLIWRSQRRADARARWRDTLESVPGFGGAARHQRQALFASVLEASHETGVTLDRATQLAGAASGTAAATAAALQISKGVPLGTALQQTTALTPELTARIATAETAGELSEELRRISREEQEKAENSLDRAVTIATKGFYSALVLAAFFYMLFMLSGVFTRL